MLFSLAQRYITYSRLKRAEWLRAKISLRQDAHILDLGGGDGGHFHTVFPEHRNVVVADLDDGALERARARFGYQTVRLVPGSPLPFPDKAFDFVFCSSVIEHVTGDKDDVWQLSQSEFSTRADACQSEFAQEIRRVGKSYFVQTPNKYFIVESHSWLPGFIVLLPRRALIFTLQVTNRFWPKGTRPDWRLFDVDRMRAFFPDAHIEEERSFGLVKSLMAMRIDA